MTSPIDNRPKENAVTQLRTPHRRSAWLAGALGAAALALGSAALPAGASPAARAASHSCSVPHYPGLGYFTSLKVSGTSCSTGSKLTLAYYRCRTRNGGKQGTCHSTVMGFTCHEKRVSDPTTILGRVTCTRGSAKVVHTYQQNL
jgi:hypothetical protein